MQDSPSTVVIPETIEEQSTGTGDGLEARVTVYNRRKAGGELVGDLAGHRLQLQLPHVPASYYAILRVDSWNESGARV